jgi:hypothetical protein
MKFAPKKIPIGTARRAQKFKKKEKKEKKTQNPDPESDLT